MKKLLLLSNSTMAGAPYLNWPKQHIKTFLGSEVTQVLFIPYAGVTISYDDYTNAVATVLTPMGYEVTGIHTAANEVEAVQNAQAIAIGGGNTFRQLELLYEKGLVEAIRTKGENGTPIMGWSAGSNVCCPTVKTTNDMPIAFPPTFDALNLVPFQINPHYTEATIPDHGGESRDQRILEFLEVNQDMTVAGLPEGTLLRVEGEKVTFEGEDLKIFRYGREIEAHNGPKEFDLNLH